MTGRRIYGEQQLHSFAPLPVVQGTAPLHGPKKRSNHPPQRTQHCAVVLAILEELTAISRQVCRRCPAYAGHVGVDHG